MVSKNCGFGVRVLFGGFNSKDCRTGVSKGPGLGFRVLLWWGRPTLKTTDRYVRASGSVLGVSEPCSCGGEVGNFQKSNGGGGGGGVSTLIVGSRSLAKFMPSVVELVP